MANDPRLVLLVPLLLTCAVIAVAFVDLSQRRIPNLITFPLAGIGIALQTLRGLEGLRFALLGLAVGFSLLFVPYLFKAMGAGDVKFLAAIGTFVGAYGSLRVLLLGLMIYPVLAFFFVATQGKLKLTLRRFTISLLKFIGIFISWFSIPALQLQALDNENEPSARTPFGVTLSIGTILALFTTWLQ